MSLEAADIAFATELFADLPDLGTRRMFGGLGLYSQGTIFARKSGAQSAMPCRTLPDAALDDPALASALARDALAALHGDPPA